MPLNQFAVLVSPTYRCNADCEYCYENRTSDVMALKDFESLLQRIVNYLREHDVTRLKLYWQGGEIFTMAPEWFLKAHDIIRDLSEKAGLNIENLLQSNLIGYGTQWRRVVAEMFDNAVGSSLDFPNLYRKVAGGTAETFNRTWYRRFQVAKDDGIQIGVIAVLNGATLTAGARRFYSYYVEDLGISNLQMNTPYPGGRMTTAKRGFPLASDLLSDFYSDLFDIWMRERRCEGHEVSLSPFDQLIHYFRTGESRLSCGWGKNCAHSFIGIDPKGNVSQCEGFVASYPEFVFGNLLTCRDMADIMDGPIRKQFLERPVRLMEQEDCAECEYLPVCHGGCPVHAYSTTGNLFTKAPNCQSNKTLFSLARNAAVECDRLESNRRANSRADSCVSPCS